MVQNVMLVKHFDGRLKQPDLVGAESNQKPVMWSTTGMTNHKRLLARYVKIYDILPNISLVINYYYYYSYYYYWTKVNYFNLKL